MSAAAHRYMLLWQDGDATLHLGEYTLQLGEAGRPEPEHRTTSDWKLIKDGRVIYRGEGPQSGINGSNWTDARDGLALLCTFLNEEWSRRMSTDGEYDDSYFEGATLFPDATPGLLKFIDRHGEELSGFEDDDEDEE